MKTDYKIDEKTATLDVRTSMSRFNMYDVFVLERVNCSRDVFTLTDFYSIEDI